MRITYLALLTCSFLPGLAEAKPVPLSPHLNLQLSNDADWREVPDHGALGLPARLLKNLPEGWQVYHRYELKVLPSSEQKTAASFRKPCEIALDYQTQPGKPRVEPMDAPWKGCQMTSANGAQVFLWVPVPTRHGQVFEVHSFYFPSPAPDPSQRTRFLKLLTGRNR